MRKPAFTKRTSTPLPAYHRWELPRGIARNEAIESHSVHEVITGVVIYCWRVTCF